MWWLGALFGAVLSFIGVGNFFVNVIVGVLSGFAVQRSISTQIKASLNEVSKLREQLAAVKLELQDKIQALELRLHRLQLELSAKNKLATSVDASGKVNADPQVQQTKQTNDVDSEAEIPTMQSDSVISPSHAQALKVTDQAAISTENISQSVTATTSPQTPAQSTGSSEYAAPPESNMIDGQSAEAPTRAIRTETSSSAQSNPAYTRDKVGSPARNKPIVPPKPLRERLPAPVAKFLFEGNVLVKAGIFILFLGIAFLLRYAAERVTVPIEQRYVSILALGLGFLFLGWRLVPKRRDYGLSIQGLAIGIFYLTTLAAFKLHSLIPAEFGLVVLLAVSVLSASLAIMQKAPVLAIVASVAGFISPVLTSTGESRPLGLFTYLAILDIGIFIIAWFNAWRVLNLIAFVGTLTLAGGWAQRYYVLSDYPIAQPFLIGFFVLFSIIGVLYARRTLAEARISETAKPSTLSALNGMQQVGRIDSALVFGNPITAFGLQYLMVKHTQYGAAISAIGVALFYVFVARWVFAKERQGLRLLSEAYLIVAVIFATLAIPLGLEGQWTSAAWAMEAAGMFWLGIRQQRAYARAFAYIVAVGACVKLLMEISWANTGTVLLVGPLLGPVLLGVSILTMWILHLRQPLSQQLAWETKLHPILAWLGIASLELLPWMLFPSQFAAATNALSTLIIYHFALRYQLPTLVHITGATQAIAVISFMFTLHLNQEDNGQFTGFLADGWRATCAILMIVGSLLINTARFTFIKKREWIAQGRGPQWGVWTTVSLLTIMVLLQFSMLFYIDLAQASVVWPLTATLFLWVALWMSHRGLAMGSLGFQLISVFLFLIVRNDPTPTLFAHSAFLAPLTIAIAGWFCGDLIRTEAQKYFSYQKRLAQDAISTFVWTNVWCTKRHISTFCVIWGLLWWLNAWLPESYLYLDRHAKLDALPIDLLVIGLVTSLFMAAIGTWRQWRAMSIFSHTSTIIFGFSVLYGWWQQEIDYLPSNNWGWLLWPIALIWSGYFLRKTETQYALSSRLLKILHAPLFWLFLLVTSCELQGQLLSLSLNQSSWQLIGWVLVPAWMLFMLGGEFLKKCWPLSKHMDMYAYSLSLPVAIYLAIWTWITNLVSTGDMSPMSYIPIINPLEISLLLIGLSLVHWWTQLPPTSALSKQASLVKSLAAASGFVVVSASVLRMVHHYAGVNWEISTLFDSRLAQAAISITWALLGVGAMVLGNRRESRTIWFAGAGLLGIVVVKLFIIELADRGGIYRIVSFLGVGAALLLVGYFAAVPAKKINTTKLQEGERDATTL